jgi:multiple sugar transport system permease protein
VGTGPGAREDGVDRLESSYWSTSVMAPSVPRRRSLSLSRRKAFLGYLYISPFLLGFVLFTLGPAVASAYFSLTDYNILSTPGFVGLANYQKAFVGDNLFWLSLGNTLYYALISVPLSIAGALGCAILLNQKIKARAVFRTIFFLPSITPVVASTLIWIWILNPEFGLLNYALSIVGIAGPKWLGSPEWAKPSLILMYLWGSIGGGAMIIFLAGLQGVPPELHESAAIDGANAWHRFLNITIPMLTPSIFLNLVLGLIGGLRVFTVAFVATNGGPAYATYFFMLHLFNQAFQYLEMGYGSALAWIFTVIVLILTIIQFRLSDRWVYYAGKD